MSQERRPGAAGLGVAAGEREGGLAVVARRRMRSV